MGTMTECQIYLAGYQDIAGVQGQGGRGGGLKGLFRVL